MSVLTVESSDLIKLVIQFLQENQLEETARILQLESQVSLNNVTNLDGFIQDILHGKWDAVLEAVKNIKLPMDKLIALFSQIVLELAENMEFDLARSLLRTVPAMQNLKNMDPARYLFFERFLARNVFDAKEAYSESKEKSRKSLADMLKTEVVSVPSSRLLTLALQGLKWQRHLGLLPKGSSYDLFSGVVPVEEDRYVTRNERILKFGGKSYPTAALFTRDGSLITGSSDGFVEVWDVTSGKIDRTLTYQANDDFMMHEEMIMFIAVTRDMDSIATADAAGVCKIWRISTGSCLKKIITHSKAVTSVSFNMSGSSILTSSMDTTARIHGLNSSRMLVEFRGHTSFVNSAIYIQDDSRVVTASSDCTMKIWDAKTGDVISLVNVGNAMGLSLFQDKIYLVTKASHFAEYATPPSGAPVHSYVSSNNSKDKTSNFVSVARNSRFIYALTDDCLLYVYEKGEIVHVIKTHDKGVLGLVLHPHSNFLATFSDDGTVKLWKS